MCVHSWSARLLDWLARAANVGRRIFARILLRLPQRSKAKRTSVPGHFPIFALIRPLRALHSYEANRLSLC